VKNNPQGWVLFALALPAVVLGYVWIILLCILFMAEWKSLRFQGAGVLTTRTRKWAAKFWGYSTTLGRAILYHPYAYDETPEIDNRTERHEFVHIKQWEDALAWSFIAGLLTATLAALLAGIDVGEFFAVWGIGWVLGVATKATNFLTAMLRYGPKGVYRDTEHERSAYAQTDYVRQAALGKGWDQLRDEHREAQEGLLG
jgi:hypothetical protein